VANSANDRNSIPNNVMENSDEPRTFDWESDRLPDDIRFLVAGRLVQADVIFLAAYWPVPSSDLGVWDFIHSCKQAEDLKPVLRSLYKGRLVHVRHAEHGSDALRRRRNHFPYIIYLRADIRCFAEVVFMLSGSSLCHYPVDDFERLKVLTLDIWPSTALYSLLAERTISQHVTKDGPRAYRPTVRILATVSDLSHQAQPDEDLARKLNMAFEIARRQYQSARVRIPPDLEEIRIKTNLVPREFEALQGQTFHERGVGTWRFQTTALAGPGELVLLWTLQSDTVSADASGGSSMDSAAEPLSVDELLNLSDLRP
jgi:hypothetical protein